MSALLRETRETRVHVSLERAGEVRIDSGLRFLDHMLNTLARYAGVGLVVEARGDLKHHLIEDVAITLGMVLARDIPPACARYGESVIPMDDALVQVVLDLGGRPYYCGRVPSSLYEHFFRSLADNAGITLHVRVLRGEDRHHIIEAIFKACGLALRQALSPADATFSTKGAVNVEPQGE
jgi:imidazoleglycerol-phosphate dehydratase